jgi:hypothetical protein
VEGRTVLTAGYMKWLAYDATNLRLAMWKNICNRGAELELKQIPLHYSIAFDPATQPASEPLTKLLIQLWFRKVCYITQVRCELIGTDQNLFEGRGLIGEHSKVVLRLKAVYLYGSWKVTEQVAGVELFMVRTGLDDTFGHMFPYRSNHLLTLCPQFNKDACNEEGYRNNANALAHALQPVGPAIDLAVLHHMCEAHHKNQTKLDRKRKAEDAKLERVRARLMLTQG